MSRIAIRWLLLAACLLQHVSSFDNTSGCSGLNLRVGGLAYVDLECMGNYTMLWIPSSCTLGDLTVSPADLTNKSGNAVVIIAMNPNRTWSYYNETQCLVGGARQLLLRNISVAGENVSFVINSALLFSSIFSSDYAMVITLEKLNVTRGALVILRGDAITTPFTLNFDFLSTYDPSFGFGSSNVTTAVRRCNVLVDAMTVSNGGVLVFVGSFNDSSSISVRHCTFLVTNVTYFSSYALPFVTINPMSLPSTFDTSYTKALVLANLTIANSSSMMFESNTWISDADVKMAADLCIGIYVAGGSFLVSANSSVLFRAVSVWTSLPIHFTADLVVLDSSSLTIQESVVNSSFTTGRNVQLRSFTIVGGSTVSMSSNQLTTRSQQGIYIGGRQVVDTHSSFLFLNNQMVNGAASFIFFNGLSQADVLMVSNYSRYLVFNNSFVTQANVLRWNLPLSIQESSVFAFSGNIVIGPGAGLWFHLGVNVSRRSIFLISENDIRTGGTLLASTDNATFVLSELAVCVVGNNTMSSGAAGNSVLASLGGVLAVSSNSRLYFENNTILSLFVGVSTLVCFGLQYPASVTIDPSSWVTFNTNRCRAVDSVYDSNITLWRGAFLSNSTSVGSVYCNAKGGVIPVLDSFVTAVDAQRLFDFPGWCAFGSSLNSSSAPCYPLSYCFMPLTARTGGPLFGGSNLSCQMQCHCSVEGDGGRCFPRTSWRLLLGVSPLFPIEGNSASVSTSCHLSNTMSTSGTKSTSPSLSSSAHSSSFFTSETPTFSRSITVSMSSVQAPQLLDPCLRSPTQLFAANNSFWKLDGSTSVNTTSANWTALNSLPSDITISYSDLHSSGAEWVLLVNSSFGSLGCAVSQILYSFRGRPLNVVDLLDVDVRDECLRWWIVPLAGPSSCTVSYLFDDSLESDDMFLQHLMAADIRGNRPFFVRLRCDAVSYQSSLEKKFTFAVNSTAIAHLMISLSHRTVFNVTAAASCISAPMSSPLVIAVTPVPETVPQQVLDAIATTTVVLSVVSVNPVAASTQARTSILLSLTACNYASINAGYSITGLGLGPNSDAPSYVYRGAVVGNILLFLGLCLPGIVVVIAARLRSVLVYRNICEGIHAPSFLHLYASVVMPPTLSSSVSLFVVVNEDWAFGANAAVGILGLVLCLGYACLVSYVLIVHKRTNAPSLVVCPKTAKVADDRMLLSDVKKKLLLVFEGPDHWTFRELQTARDKPSNGETIKSCSLDEEDCNEQQTRLVPAVLPTNEKELKDHFRSQLRWKHKQFIFFREFRFMWYVVFDLWVGIVISGLNGIVIGVEIFCSVQLALLSLLFLILFAFDIWLRPAMSIFGNGGLLMVHLLSAVCGIAALTGVYYQNPDVISVATVVATVVGVIGSLQAIPSTIQLVFTLPTMVRNVCDAFRGPSTHEAALVVANNDEIELGPVNLEEVACRLSPTSEMSLSLGGLPPASHNAAGQPIASPTETIEVETAVGPSEPLEMSTSLDFVVDELQHTAQMSEEEMSMLGLNKTGKFRPRGLSIYGGI